MSDTEAKLVGGPVDGRVVEIMGIRYSAIIISNGKFLEARYVWKKDRDGSYIGRFVGYWRKGRKVDKLGRKKRTRRA